jgi:hypothetical protein
MNSFDAAVYLCLVIAAVTGFNAGLLRSAVTILAYLIAMPIAVWAMSLVSPGIDGNLTSPLSQNSLLFFGTFLIAGMGLGKLMRMALDENHRASSRDRRSPRRRGAWRGARRPCRDHAGADFRFPRAIGSPAGVPRRLAIAAVIVGGRAEGL